jgi:tRNA-binding EMAP/Myf-like protein
VPVNRDPLFLFVALKIMPDLSQYKVGVVLSVEDCGNQSKNAKARKACSVNVGDESNPVTIVTSASNVRVGSR